jgi:tetratricopeptide (TPR) repeat protein
MDEAGKKVDDSVKEIRETDEYKEAIKE